MFGVVLGVDIVQFSQKIGEIVSFLCSKRARFPEIAELDSFWIRNNDDVTRWTQIIICKYVDAITIT